MRSPTWLFVSFSPAGNDVPSIFSDAPGMRLAPAPKTYVSEGDASVFFFAFQATIFTPSSDTSPGATFVSTRKSPASPSALSADVMASARRNPSCGVLCGIAPFTTIVESALHSPDSPSARTRALIVSPCGGTTIPPSTSPAFE